MLCGLQSHASSVWAPRRLAEVGRQAPDALEGLRAEIHNSLVQFVALEHPSVMSSLPELGRKYTGVTLRVMKKLPCGNLQQMAEWKDVTGCFRRHLGCFYFTRTFPSGQVVEYGLHTASQVILFALEGTFEHPDAFMQ